MAQSEQRDLFPGALEIMILHTLRRRPLHGYALVQHLQRISELQIEEGSVYPALQRMLRAGWLHAAWSMSSTNRKVRVYRVTANGQRHLEDARSSFERMFQAMSRVLAPRRS